MLRNIISILGFGILLQSFAAAQIQGNQSFVRLPGEIDENSRMTGFEFENEYYIPFVDYSSGTADGSPPSVYYGQVSGTGTATTLAPAFAGASKVAIPGVGGNGHLCHQAAAILHNAPYIFQFTCTRENSPRLLNATYEKLIPPLPGGTAPTFTTAGSMSKSIVSALGYVYDVAAASLNGEVYVFVLCGNSSGPNAIDVLSYAGTGSGGPVLQSSVTLAGTDSTIQGVDATNVTLASGEQAIVVAAPFVGSGIAEMKTWFFTGAAGTINPYSMQNPPWANYPAAVRMAYGPANGTAKVNSLTMFYAALEGGVFGVSSEIFTAQLALPPSLESGSPSQTAPWAQLSGIWQNSNNTDYTQYPYNWTCFSVALPTSSTGTTVGTTLSNVNQYVTLVEKGDDNGEVLERRNSFVTSLALQLQADPTTPSQVWDSSEVANLSPADQTAAVESWNLLGVVTGLPPLPAGTTVNNRTPLLTLQYSSSMTDSYQLSSATVVTANASAETEHLEASVDFTNSTQEGSVSTSSLTLALQISFNADTKTNNYANEADEGYLIVSQPKYVTHKYHAYAYDGTTPLGISMVSIAAESTTTLTAIPFRLSDPLYNMPGYPSCIYDSFPEITNGPAQVVYPQMTDIAGWETPPTLNDVQPLFPSYGPPNLEADTFSSEQEILSSSSNRDFSGATSNTIDVDTDVSFFGIGAGGSNSFEMMSQTSVGFNTSEASVINYPELQNSNGYSQIELEVLFDRLIDKPTTPPNWMPAIFTGSKPWILSWKVYSATTAGASANPPPTGHGPFPHFPFPR